MAMRLLLTLAVFLAAPLAAADYSGTWNLDGDVAGNVIKGACTLKQEGTKVTGVCKLEGKADADATGEAGEEKLVFQHKVEHNGNIYTLEYTGKRVSETELKGDINVPNTDAKGVFTAKKG